jgi:hypothetical protein
LATTVTPAIVVLNASVTLAPTNPALQQSACLISVGGTTATTGTTTFCANLAAVTAILSASGNFAELTKMATTWFAQGTNTGVSVLELGASGGVGATQITSFGTWLTNNASQPVQPFYGYVLPNTWDTSNSTNVNTLAASYASATGKTYFAINSTSSNFANYTNKVMQVMVPGPTQGSTEHDAAAWMYQYVSQIPSASTPAAPMNLRALSNVTPWPYITAAGTAQLSTLTTILTGFGNYVDTGTEGGLGTLNIIKKGTNMDGNQSMFWYAGDWALVQMQVQIANALINAAQPGNARIWFDQFGINTLLGVINGVCLSGTQFGLFLSAIPSATPFNTYINANPANYEAGIYGGFSVALIPKLGFGQITLNLTVSNFA